MANRPTNKPTTKTAIDKIAGADITNLYLLYLIMDCACIRVKIILLQKIF